MKLKTAQIVNVNTKINKVFQYIYIHRRLLILFLTYLFLSTDTTGQIVKTWFNDSVHLTVKHRKYEQNNHINNQRITNQYLEAFSKSIPRILAYTTYQVHWHQKIQYENTTITNSIQGLRLSGYTDYRGFSMKDFLVPAKVIYTYDLSYQGIALSFSDTLTRTTSRSAVQVPDSLSEKKLTFEDFHYQFFFQEEQAQKFRTKMQAIDQYYLDFPILKNTLEKVASIGTANLNMLPIYSANLREAESVLKQLKNRSYQSILNLEETDPLEFLPRFQNLNSGIAFKRQRIDRQLKNIDRLFYQEGINYLNTDTSIARAYFEKAIQSNPYYSPAYLEIARLNLTQHKLPEAASAIEHILQQLKPDTATYQKIMSFNDTLLTAFINKGKHLLDMEDYNAAVAILERAKHFCDSTPNYTCQAPVDKYLSQAKYGIYKAYTDVARKAIDNERPEMALRFIQQVDRFQQNNSRAIISNQEIKGLYAETAELFIKKARLSLDLNEFKAALAHLQKADSICPDADCRKRTESSIVKAHQGIYENLLKESKTEYQNGYYQQAVQILSKADKYLLDHQKHTRKSSSHDTLKKSIDYQLYRSNLKKGSTFLNFSKPKTALSHFLEAQHLLNQYHFEHNDTLDTLISAAARPLILSALKQGELKLWGHKYQQAFDILNDIEKDTAKYHLENDFLIAQKISSFEHELTKAFCQEVSDSIQTTKEQAYSLLKKDKYIQAELLLEQSLALVQRHAICSLPARPVTDTLELYEDVFRYFRSKIRLDSLRSQKKYEETITLIRQMQENYENHKLVAAKAGKISLTKYGGSQQDDALKVYYLRYQLKQQQNKKALVLLRTISSKLLKSKKGKQWQKEIAERMAREDARAQKAINYKAQATEYSKNIPELSVFERHYSSKYRQEAKIFPWFF
ncbi:MAG: hypothetical protein R6T91_09650 [Bacteroidales bacterium]